MFKKPLLPLSILVALVSGFSGTVVALAVSSPLAPSPLSEAEESFDTIYEFENTSDAPYIRELTLQPGSTLASSLSAQGICDPQLIRYVNSPNAFSAAVRRLKPPQALFLRTNRLGEALAIQIPLSDAKQGISITKGSDTRFVQQNSQLPMERRARIAEATIQTNLFAAIDAANLPEAIATGLVDVFAKRVDFHGSFRKGDRFKIIYESAYFNGIAIGGSKVLAAELVSGKKQMIAINYQLPNGVEEYFTPEGSNLSRGMLRSPVEYSRVTSSFSAARTHPLFRDLRHHTGTDFAAPAGSRVLATEAGVVAFIGSQGGYGNVVILNHDKDVSTVYGHLSAFTTALVQGARVKQGQTIGFVGQTGWATGPHLHYEYRLHNVSIDPEKRPLAKAPPLTGRQITAFRTHTAGLLTQLSLPVTRQTITSAH